MSRRKKQPLNHPELGLPEVRSLWQTVGLFSEHYLKSRIQQNNWWPTDKQAAPLWEFCQQLVNKRARWLRITKIFPDGSIALICFDAFLRVTI